MHHRSQRTNRPTRRGFLKTTGAVAAGATLLSASRARAQSDTPALLGGAKAVTIAHGDADRWPLYDQDDEKAVVELLRNPGYAALPALEADWKKYYNVPYVKAQCNGTSALASMFFALNLPAGSEILVPSYTFFATIVPMRLFGLVPVFVDIDPHSLDMSLEDAKKRLTKNTKAILPVHWFGNPADMDGICEFAKQKGLIVLEDCAHAHGSRLQDKLMGTWGVMSIFSYQMTKPLPGIEGGMNMFTTREYYERGTSFGHYDAPGSFGEDSPYHKYDRSGLGTKTRMHPVSAVLCRTQMKHLDRRNSEGAAQVRSLNDRLLELPGLYDQTTRKDAKRLYYAANMLFVDEKKAGLSRGALVKALKAEGVLASEYSYTLQHKLALYREAQWWHHLPEIPDLPGSEQANATGIHLPYWTRPVPEVVEQYVKAFQKIWAHRKELPTA